MGGRYERGAEVVECLWRGVCGGGVCGGGGGGCGGERCLGADRQKTEDRRQPATAVAGEGKLGGVTQLPAMTQLPVTRPLLPRLLSLLLPGQPHGG